jgi:hypothetical protein
MGVGNMAKTTDVVNLARKHGLPGHIEIRRHSTGVVVELDLPGPSDRIDEQVIPGVQALVVGFHKRLVNRSRSTGNVQLTTVTDDYVTAWVHREDLDHFLVSPTALLDGAAMLTDGRSDSA